MRYRKNLSDAIFGDTNQALTAAKAWRDLIFLTHPGNSKAAAVTRLEPTNTSGVTGVTRAKVERNGQLFHYWVAGRPKARGEPHQSKKFSIAKYGEEKAFLLAVGAREAFVAEFNNIKNHHHRAARQLQKSLNKLPSS